MSLKIPRPRKKSFSAISVTEGNELVSQTLTRYTQHHSQKKFMLISKEIGYFNRITKFVCTDDSSLVFFNPEGKQVHTKISELTNEYILYPCPFPVNNPELIIKKQGTRYNKPINTQEKINLTFSLGVETGEVLARQPEFLYEFFQIINAGTQRFWPDKKFLTNTNPNYCIGILFGYFNYFYKKFPELIEISKTIKKYSADKILFLNDQDNVYTFTCILNLLGAKYQITNLKEPVSKNSENSEDNENFTFTKYIDIKLPIHWKTPELIKEINSYDFPITNFFKKYEIFFINGKFQIIHHPVISNIEKNPINEMILNGSIFVSTKNIKFIPTKEYVSVWDFISERADATNYSLPFCPILKNSDGDILTGSGIMGEESLKEVNQLLSPNNIDYFRGLNDGQILNYIKDDALLGLFSATKYI